MASTAKTLATLGAALVLAACSASPPPQLIVDEALADGDVYEVTGLSSRRWGQPLRFGSFATRETRVGESWSWSAGLFDTTAGVRTEPYRFVLVGERGAEWHVECRARTPMMRHLDGDGGSTEVDLGPTRLGCALRGDGDAVSSLSLVGTGLEFTGGARFGDEELAIRGLHQVADREGRPRRIPAVLGYEIRAGERVVGSVDTLGDGRVYLAPGLTPEQRDRIAATAAVLLFFGEA